MQALKNYFDELSTDEPLIRKNMVIYPILGHDRKLPTVISLDEALEKNFLRVREVGDSGSVPELLISNRSEYHILILEGEEVIGGKQNRVFNTSLLVMPGMELKAGVACSEAGRWNEQGENFTSSENLISSSIRSGSRRAVTMNLREHGVARTDQSQVWEGIQCMSAAYDSQSATSAYREIKDGARARLADYTRDLFPARGQVGAFFEVNGKPLGMEIIHPSDLWVWNMVKIVESFATEALRHGQNDQLPDPARVESSLDLFARGAVTSHDSAGAGLDVRFDGPGFLGSALYWMDTFVHLSVLFHEEERQTIRNPMSGYKDRLGKRRSGQE